MKARFTQGRRVRDNAIVHWFVDRKERLDMRQHRIENIDENQTALCECGWTGELKHHREHREIETENKPPTNPVQQNVSLLFLIGRCNNCNYPVTFENEDSVGRCENCGEGYTYYYKETEYWLAPKAS